MFTRATRAVLHRAPIRHTSWHSSLRCVHIAGTLDSILLPAGEIQRTSKFWQDVLSSKLSSAEDPSVIYIGSAGTCRLGLTGALDPIEVKAGEDRSEGYVQRVLRLGAYLACTRMRGADPLAIHSAYFPMALLATSNFTSTLRDIKRRQGKVCTCGASTVRRDQSRALPSSDRMHCTKCLTLCVCSRANATVRSSWPR